MEPTVTISETFDDAWILLCAFIMFFMKAGFIMLEASCCRTGRDVLLRLKLLDMAVGGISFWLIGFTLLKTEGTAFVGDFSFDREQFKPGGTKDGFQDEALWQLHFAFAANAATIVTGAVLGRVQLGGYLVGTIVITAIVHPIVGHWVWYKGWLDGSSSSFPFPHAITFIDYAGGVMVHGVGGLSALICSIFVGPAPDVSWASSEKNSESSYLATVGVLILWFGWYGFNCGATAGISGGKSLIVSHIAMTMTLAALAAGNFDFVWQYCKIRWTSSKIRKVGIANYSRPTDWDQRMAEFEQFVLSVDRLLGIVTKVKQLIFHLSNDNQREERSRLYNKIDMNTLLSIFQSLDYHRVNDKSQEIQREVQEIISRLPPMWEDNKPLSRQSNDLLEDTGSQCVVCRYSVADCKGLTRKSMENAEDCGLKTWLETQRAMRRDRKLPSENVKKLDSLDFVWDPTIEYDLRIDELLNCLLTGLVASSVCGQVIPPWLAILLGIACVLVYRLGVVFEERIGIQDNLRAFPVHFMGALIGIIFAPIAVVFPDAASRFNLYYPHLSLETTTFGGQMLCQLVGLLAIMLFTIITMTTVYFLLWWINWLAWSQEGFLSWWRQKQLYKLYKWCKPDNPETQVLVELQGEISLINQGRESA